MSDLHFSIPRTYRFKQVNSTSQASIDLSFHRQVPLNPRQKLYLDLSNIHNDSKVALNLSSSTKNSKIAALPLLDLSFGHISSRKILDDSFTARYLDTIINSPYKDIDVTRVRSRRSYIQNNASPIKRELKFPMLSYDALRYFPDNLTEYEHTEILEYPEVYFLGHKNTKINGKITDVN